MAQIQPFWLYVDDNFTPNVTVCWLVWTPPQVLGDQVELAPRRSMAQIQQANCEAETLKVFRLLTSQVSTGSILMIRPNMDINGLRVIK